MKQEKTSSFSKKRRWAWILLGLSILAIGVGIFYPSEDKKMEEKKKDQASLPNSSLNQDSLNEEKKEETEEEKLGQKVRFSGLSAYVDAPHHYFVTEEGLTMLAAKGDEMYIAVTSTGFDKATTLTEAQEMILDTLKIDLRNYSVLSKLTIDQSKIESINGIETYRYEGSFISKAPNGSDYSAYTVGYSFLIDNIPCNITGLVTELSQSEEKIQEIRTLVDEMIYTVRIEE